MNQVLQDLRTGQTSISAVPTPLCRRGTLLINSKRSLISAGTERMLVEFGQANLLDKARSQPEKVRQVLDKARTDGWLSTFDAVRSKLGQPIPLGYCNVGSVVEVGDGVTGYTVGDRVASNGHHAEAVCVPQNLCARIPDGVSDEEAAFTVPGAIALQGIRLLQPTLGERIAVLGLGLLGLLAVKLLRANGCRVLGVDVAADRLELARQAGAEVVDAGADPVAAGMAFSQGRGMDGVLITASTPSDAVVRQAAQMSRKRGRLVLVGVVGLNLDRADFYEKELSFQVSCSYGPGRYDSAYEDKGRDYPFGLVRWTEQRNFDAVLQLIADGGLDVKPLVTHTVPLGEAERAYRLLTDDPQALGIMLTYADTPAEPVRTIAGDPAGAEEGRSVGSCRVGMIGAGNFATAVMLPCLKKSGAGLQAIASAGGTAAAVAGRKFGFAEMTAEVSRLMSDPSINTVFVATRHNTHARLAVESLRAGKHVFVEKPLALNLTELDDIRRALDESPGVHLMVGFNRRFAPLAVKMKKMLDQRAQPMNLVYTVNAGAIPADHWTQDRDVGGGRIIGEGCHFIDLLRFLVGYGIAGVEARMVGGEGGGVREDKMTIMLDFADGSCGVVHYLANGNKSFPKERLEVFGDGRVLVLDNFRVLEGHGWPGFRRERLWRQDKGHQAEVDAFVALVEKGGEPLIPWQELEEVSLATFAAVRKAGEPASGLFEGPPPA